MFEFGKAICYSGYRNGQHPDKNLFPSTEQIKQDLAILNKLGFKYLRMYDPNEYARETCRVIRGMNYDMKLMLGPGLISELNNPNCTWLKETYTEEELAARAEHNDEQIGRLIALANEYDDVINVVSIGNENTPDWGANTVPVERLMYFADRLKRGTSKPVTFNEGVYEWPKLEALAEKLDIICIHSYPLWNGKDIEEAVEADRTWYNKIKALYPKKPVWFSEVGWASSAVDFAQMKEGMPTEENAQRYYDELLPWIKKEQIISYLFEAFDEPWKGGNNPDEAEKHWGIFYENRTQKIMLNW